MERCSASLIVDNWQHSKIIQSDYRLAVMLDESSYEKIRHEASGNAVLYGVPIGSDYADFSERARELSSRHDEQFSHIEAISIAWSGLSDNALNAYTNCLKEHVGQGLILGVNEANEHQVVLSVHWISGYGAPDRIALQWDAPAEILPFLPAVGNNTNEGIPFIVPRPENGNHFIAVRGGFEGDIRFGDHIQISAYPLLTKPNLPEKQWRFSWATNATRSIISQPVPIRMIGREVKFDLYGRASSRAGGWISAEISIDGKMLFASPRIHAADNPEIRKSATLEIPITARYIKIEFPNGDSVAEYGTADISY